MFTVGRSLLWDVYLAIINIEIRRQLLWKRFFWACLSFQEIQYTIALTDSRLTEISLQRIGHSIPRHFPIAYILAISDFGNDRNPQEQGYTIHRTLVEFGETSNDQWSMIWSIYVLWKEKPHISIYDEATPMEEGTSEADPRLNVYQIVVWGK